MLLIAVAISTVLGVGIAAYVHGSSAYVAKSLADVQVRGDIRVTVLSIRSADARMNFNPDYLSALGGAEQLDNFEKLLRADA
ncbi:MAG TPA: hypothetical protein VHK90_12500 [Thermoanaerobaculia bacterium]|nr:hypothetical protein [Thermoanaerobaculia bacterium]